MLKVYTYAACSTCRDATQWLRAQHIPFTELPIRITPPSIPELQAMLDAKAGKLTAICNTSGMDYRALGLKDKLPSMSLAASLELLSTHGNLVKRPFVIDMDRGLFLVGFKPADWQRALADTPK